MDDLISRQAAIDALGERPMVWTDSDYEIAQRNQWDLDKLAIETVPSAQERKKGKWIHDGYDFPHGNDWIHCSICGKRGINVPADLTNFCPNCGADMRGEQDG